MGCHFFRCFWFLIGTRNQEKKQKRHFCFCFWRPFWNDLIIRFLIENKILRHLVFSPLFWRLKHSFLLKVLIYCNFMKSRPSEEVIKAFTTLWNSNPTWAVYDAANPDTLNPRFIRMDSEAAYTIRSSYPESNPAYNLPNRELFPSSDSDCCIKQKTSKM